MNAIDTCPQCSEPFVRHGGESATLVGSSSPKGHDHDDNCLKRIYVCPNGHKTLLSVRRSCPKCDWKGKPDCFCHKGAKVDRWPASNVRGPKDLSEVIF
jgi:hypothetical protein